METLDYTRAIALKYLQHNFTALTRASMTTAKMNGFGRRKCFFNRECMNWQPFQLQQQKKNLSPLLGDTPIANDSISMVNCNSIIGNYTANISGQKQTRIGTYTWEKNKLISTLFKSDVIRDQNWRIATRQTPKLRSNIVHCTEQMKIQHESEDSTACTLCTLFTTSRTCR